MNTMRIRTIAVAVAIALTGSGALAEESIPAGNAVPRPNLSKLPHRSQPVIPAPEPLDAAPAVSAGFSTASALSAKSGSVSPQATALGPPVTLTYSGSSNALTVTDSGTGRGISSSVTDSNSGSSALFGATVGTGAGLTGYNSGTSGPGGKFEVTNANSAQAGAFASTNGTGPALLGTVTNSNSESAALSGQNTASSYGIGVQGDGSYFGVFGTSNEGYGVEGDSEYGFGVVGVLRNGSPYTSAAGLAGLDDSPANAGSYAVYGYSGSNTSAYFTGGSGGNGYCSFSGGSGWNCSSDKNLKKDFVPVDDATLLEHLAALPVFEYSMKGERAASRYLGPTAQDFMSAFHLGDDDTLINTANAQGVALAAAKGLYEKTKQDEAEIMILKQELASQTKRMAEMEQGFSARLAMLEQQRAAGVQTAVLTE